MRLAVAFIPLLALVQLTLAACPMAELSKRGLVPEDMARRYHNGQGLGGETLAEARKREDPPYNGGGNEDAPPLLDPISGVLSPVGLGGLLPRDREAAERSMRRRQAEHFKTRMEERDEDVDENSSVLTPKAAKRHFAKRGLIGGLLAPLTGPLQALDLPTPQESGLKKIPGDDPKHQYQAPGPNDVRGNCPTLNTIANHGYISRDGISSFAELANGIQTAYSMSFDIAVFLSALGLLAGGDLVTGRYSIGGQDPRITSPLGPVYGIDRHGTFEIDASISRGDRYFGDSHSFNLSRWDKLVSDADQHGGGLFNIEAMKRNAADAVDESRATNPEFTFGANFAVVYATRALLTRPLPNGTAPEVANYENVAPFYLNETFPEDWFRIPNSYSLVDLLGDIGTLFLFKPQPLGRNYQGRFVPLELSVPTAPADVGCFAASLLGSIVPGQLQPEVEAINAVKDQLLSVVLKSANCDVSQFNSNAGSGSRSNISYVENADAGSGSGVTKLGEYNNAAKPTNYKSSSSSSSSAARATASTKADR